MINKNAPLLPDEILNRVKKLSVALILDGVKKSKISIPMDGWQLDKRVAEVVEGATFINKPTFGSTVLADSLKAISEKENIEIELIGLC